jgi:hypothetical protein
MDFSFLNNIHLIIRRYEEENRMKGTNINILNVMGKEHDEVIICKLLAFLLNPNEKHGQGNYFLDIFLQSIKEQKIEEDEIFSVITEFPTDESRRIDIVLKSNKRFLPFEVKINAGDQDEQCIHYYNYSKNHYKSEKVFYVTIDGHEPNKSSKDNLIIGTNLILLSFKSDILGWLESCENEQERKFSIPLKELIRSLKSSISNFCKIMENNNMSNEIFDVIKNNPESAEAIYKTMQTVCNSNKNWADFCKSIVDSNLNYVDNGEFGNRNLSGASDALTLQLQSNNSIDIDIHKNFHRIFIALKDKQIAKAIMEELENKYKTFILNSFNGNGFNIENTQDYFLGESVNESDIKLYDSLINNRDKIFQKIQNFINIIIDENR